MTVDLLSQVAKENRLLTRLGLAAKTASEALVAVSFATEQGAQSLVTVLAPLVGRGRKVKVYLSGYMSITDPKALDDLLAMQKNFPGRFTVHFDPSSKFHCKFILLRMPKNRFVAFVGSSNLSVSAFHEEGELNVAVEGSQSDAFFKTARVVERHIATDFNFKKLTVPMIERYRERVGKRSPRRNGSGGGESRREGAQSRKPIAPPPDYVAIPRVPVVLISRRYTKPMMELIEAVQPSWGSYIGWSRSLKGLRTGGAVVTIWKMYGKPPTFDVAVSLGDDRIKKVGHILGLESKRDGKLSTLARWLSVSEKTLIERAGSFLKPAHVLMLQERVPKAFPRGGRARSSTKD